jgi:hypothetical protein
MAKGLKNFMAEVGPKLQVFEVTEGTRVVARVAVPEERADEFESLWDEGSDPDALARMLGGRSLEQGA